MVIDSVMCVDSLNENIRGIVADVVCWMETKKKNNKEEEVFSTTSFTWRMTWDIGSYSWTRNKRRQHGSKLVHNWGITLQFNMAEVVNPPMVLWNFLK